MWQFIKLVIITSRIVSTLRTIILRILNTLITRIIKYHVK